MAPIKMRIILPGGGVKGAFQLGFLSQVLGSGMYEVDAVYGCSIGAILAPMVSVGGLARLKAIFDGIRSVTDVVQRRTAFGMPYPDWKIVQGLSSFLQMGAYQRVKLVDTVFADLSADELVLARERCHVVAYDILNNQERWFTGGQLVDGVRCSSALWLAVPPIAFEGSLFSDGGATEVFPVTYILDHDLSQAFDGQYLFVDCDARTPYTNDAPTDGLTLMSCLQWGATTRLAEYELAKLVAQLGPSLKVVRPDANLLSGALDVDPGRMQATFNAGSAKGAEFLRAAL